MQNVTQISSSFVDVIDLERKRKWRNETLLLIFNQINLFEQSSSVLSLLSLSIYSISNINLHVFVCSFVFFVWN